MVKNLKDLFAKFKDEDKCRAFLVQQRWNGQPVCPHCGHTKTYIIDKGKKFKCANQTCYKKFSVTVGTVFEASNIPLTTWFPAMYIIASHKKGISSVQLAKDLGVTQKTAWFMLHRIRKSLEDSNPGMLSGIVEIDETYLSRKFRSEYVGLTPEQIEWRNQNAEFQKKDRNKGAAMALKQRGGKIIVSAFDETKSAVAIGEKAKTYVAQDAQLMTDEALQYRHELKAFNRQSVNHSKGEWVRGIVHTNTVENFWSVMKRGIYGIYHQISHKHLQAYCNEFAYRYNTKDMQDGARFELTLTTLEGRLTYKQLVHGKSEEDQNKA
jgi:transposase-like protein